MTEGLLRAELRTVADVAELDAAEAAELFGELRAASVPLGDRSRLRKVAWGSVQGAFRAGGSAVISEPGDTSRVKAGVEPCTSMPEAELTDREGGPSAQHRQLQSGGGGFSIEVAAIAFTGLIGMVGYGVQARSAQKASDARASLAQEAAERDKAEAKAAKQRERVQLQMAEWVRPLHVENQSLLFGWLNMAKVRRPREHMAFTL
jgi:hypothetical protein